MGELVELPGSHGVHLDEGDAAAAPLPLRLIHGEEGLEEQIHDALGNRMGINRQAGQQVVHVAHVPKLESGTQESSFYTSHCLSVIWLNYIWICTKHLNISSVQTMKHSLTFSSSWQVYDWSYLPWTFTYICVATVCMNICTFICIKCLKQPKIMGFPSSIMWIIYHFQYLEC